jgi:hypothetical protein
MPFITLSEEEAESLFNDGDNAPAYEPVEVTEWEDDIKYSNCQVIFRELTTGKTYSLGVSRSGSYYTDYDYSYYLKCREVEQKEVTRLEWVQVKS